VGLCIIGLTIHLAGPQEVVEALKSLNFTSFLILLIIQLLIQLSWALKWWVVLRSSKVSFKKVLPVSMVGYLVNGITPAGMAGGEPARAYILSRIDKISTEKAAASVIVDLFLDIFPLIFFIIIAIGMTLTSPLCMGVTYLLILSGLVLTFFFILVLMLPFNEKFTGEVVHSILRAACHLPLIKNHALTTIQRVEHIIHEFHQAMNETMTDSYVLFTGIFISFITWILHISRAYLIFLFLGYNISPATIIIVRITVSAVSFIPFTPGALGVWEGVGTWLFTLFDIPASIGLAATLIDRFFTYWFGNLLGIIASVYLGIMHLVMKKYVEGEKEFNSVGEESI